MTPGKYVRIEQDGDLLIVFPLFTFGRFAEGDLRQEFQCVLKRIDSPNVKHVVVDLGEIPYFGSTLLEWIVQMWRRTSGKGGKLAACNPSAIAKEILLIAKFDQLWGIFDSRQDAIDSIADGHV